MKKAILIIIVLTIAKLSSAQSTYYIISTYDTICWNGYTTLSSTGAISLLYDNFNQAPSTSDPEWSNILGNPNVFNPCGSGPDSSYLWFYGYTNPNPLRTITTKAFNMSSGSYKIKFWMRYGREQPSGYCEDPDDVNEGVHLQYSINNDTIWTDLPLPTINPIGSNSISGPFSNVTTIPGSGGYWPPVDGVTNQQASPLYYWHRYECIIPTAAFSTATKIRWAQFFNSLNHYDTWGIDEVEIVSTTPDLIEWRDENNNLLSTNKNLGLIFPTHSQWYYASFTDTATNQTILDSIYITVLPKAALNLGIDDTLCADQSKTLNIGLGYSSIQWNTGDTTPTIIVDTTGLGLGTFDYWIKAYDQNGCLATDTIQITFLNCAGMEDKISKNFVRIYPNPTKGEFKLSINTSSFTPEIIQVFTMEGKKIQEQSIAKQDCHSECSVNLKIDSPGIYQVIISGGGESLKTKIVVVE